MEQMWHVIHDDREPVWITPQAMFDKGMFVCCYCCKTLSVDNKFCNVCMMPSVVLLDKGKSKSKKIKYENKNGK